jgi:cytochrome c
MTRGGVALAVAAAMITGGCVAGGSPERAPGQAPAPAGGAVRVLLLSKTAGYRHDSIPPGAAAIERLGPRHGFVVDHTEDAGRLNDAELRRYRALVFLSTTGEFLDEAQQGALRRFIERGGGWVGIHAASDGEFEWPWYGEMVGAWFAHHPAIQRATIHVADQRHPAMAPLPAAWTRTDEWYDFRSNPRGRVHVLATLDESSYRGGGMGADHPIAWCHQVGSGRVFYTALGHTVESFAEPLFLDHLAGAIRWAAGLDPGDCSGG